MFIVYCLIAAKESFAQRPFSISGCKGTHISWIEQLVSLVVSNN